MRQYRIKLKTQNSHQKGGQAKLKNFYHVDLYRLEDSLEKEIENLGLKEIWSDPGNIVVIEWAEKAKDFIPDYVRWIEFEYVGKRKRKIVEGMKEM